MSSKKACIFCTTVEHVYYECTNCKIGWCGKCNKYGMTLNTISKLGAFCSGFCTNNWINTEERNLSYFFQYSLTDLDYIKPFRIMQETYMDMYWSNNATKICNEFLIGDVCLVVREYLNKRTLLELMNEFIYKGLL